MITEIRIIKVKNIHKALIQYELDGKLVGKWFRGTPEEILEEINEHRKNNL